jgi:hypothetical protein
VLNWGSQPRSNGRNIRVRPGGRRLARRTRRLIRTPSARVYLAGPGGLHARTAGRRVVRHRPNDVTAACAAPWGCRPDHVRRKSNTLQSRGRPVASAAARPPHQAHAVTSRVEGDLRTGGSTFAISYCSRQIAPPCPPLKLPLPATRPLPANYTALEAPRRLARYQVGYMQSSSTGLYMMKLCRSNRSRFAFAPFTQLLCRMNKFGYLVWIVPGVASQIESVIPFG